MVRNLKRAATAGMLAAALVGSATAVPAEAAKVAVVELGDVQIVEHGWNAVGKDTSANRNSEFVRLRNTTAAAVDVEGWVLHDTYQNGAGDWGNRYTFRATDLPAGSPFKVDADGAGPDPARFTIPADAEVYVYQGSGVDSTPTSTTASIYRNGSHIWNNAGDTVYLRVSKDASGYVARLSRTSYRVKVTQ